jgi:hypothetical protein
VHLCTSTLSVGESQANVYFATWIAFASTAMNYGVWRESAGRSHVFLQYHYNNAQRHRDSALTLNTASSVPEKPYRETTYNWLWIGFFSCIFAGAATDIYFNRRNIKLLLRGEPLDLKTQDWMIILSVVWSEVALCCMAVTLNSMSGIKPPSCRLPRFVIDMDENVHERYRCVFGWRQWEGLVILFTTGLKFWVILKYAAVDGVIPGLSNAYFGVWGSFFNGVFCFGTWLRENKNIEYIVLETDGYNNNNTNNRSRSHGRQ